MALTVKAPLKAPPVPESMDTVTAPVLAVRFPWLSRISTTGGVAISTPLTTPDGCVATASWVDNGTSIWTERAPLAIATPSDTVSV